MKMVNRMRGWPFAGWSLLLGLSLGGCWKDNPNYCEGAPNNSCALLDAAAPRCATDDDCAAPTGACDVPSGVCVECTADDATACTGTTPVCADTLTCAGCTAHADCAGSDVCLPSGACAAEADVAYVAPTGSGAACSKALPCATLAAAIATSKPTVKFASGIVKDAATTVITGRAVTLVAAPDAILDRDGDGPILDVQGAGANVEIYDLAITGASGPTDAIGIRLLANGGTPQLTLERVKVSGNQGAGITTSGGTLTITRSTLSENADGGLATTTPGVVTLTHNFIYRNGNPTTATVGGALLRPMTGSKVEFNTIVDNQADQASLSAGGWLCDTVGFMAPGNLVFRNVGGPAGTTQTIGSCALGNSFSQAAAIGDNTPMFVSPNVTPLDYHLTAATPTSIRDAAGACTGTDVDGQPRPSGGACDLGADELVP